MSDSGERPSKSISISLATILGVGAVMVGGLTTYLFEENSKVGAIAAKQEIMLYREDKLETLIERLNSIVSQDRAWGDAIKQLQSDVKLLEAQHQEVLSRCGPGKRSELFDLGRGEIFDLGDLVYSEKVDLPRALENLNHPKN